MAPIPTKDDFILKDLEPLSCGICSDPYDTDHVPVQIGECRHIFGRPCILKWFETDGAMSNTCPTCRAVLYQAEAEDEETVATSRPMRRTSNRHPSHRAARPTHRHRNRHANRHGDRSMISNADPQNELDEASILLLGLVLDEEEDAENNGSTEVPSDAGGHERNRTTEGVRSRTLNREHEIRHDDNLDEHVMTWLLENGGFSSSPDRTTSGNAPHGPSRRRHRERGYDHVSRSLDESYI